MSSLRNAVQRKSHKERSQPANRTKWGLLEKHKDYVLRAQDFHKKSKAIAVLKSKAAFRNPDEFYFGMINAKTKKGVHIQERNESFDHDLIKLLKTQDKNYIHYAKSINAKKLEKMSEGSLLELGGADQEQSTSRKRKSNHVIFVDSMEDAKKFDPVEHFGTTPELVSQPWNRLKKETLETVQMPELGEEEIKALQKARVRKLGEMSSRLDRHDKLRKVEMELDMQKQLMGKGPRQKVGVDSLGLPIYKWKPLRKK